MSADSAAAVACDLPVDALERYLLGRLPGFGGVASIRRFAGGQSNPTYLLTSGVCHYVLRRKPFGVLLPSAHAVEREYRVLQALADSSVPVPRPLHLCLDQEVIGSVFYVMAFVDGRIHWDPALPGLDRELRRRVYAGAGQVLGALAKLDVDCVGLGEFGKRGGYLTRQIRRWTEQYRAAETERREEFEHLIAWLPTNLPANDDEFRLVHGDFRLDNLVFADDGTVVAVLDWELSTLGHPLADLAYQCAQWRLPAGELRGLQGVDRATLGIPSESEFVEGFLARSGRAEITHWTFHLVISLFRLASICQGVYRRALEGNASSPDALRYGRVTQQVAAVAAELAT